MLHPNRFPIFSLITGILLITSACIAQPKPAADKPADAKPVAPDPLPGKGLAHHDFFYAGEAKSQNMYIVKKGRSSGLTRAPLTKARSVTR